MLTDGTLKFTCPSEFNDPFDCAPAFELGSEFDLAERMKSKWSLSPEEYAKTHKNISESLENGSYLNGLHNLVGVLSLSRTPVGILMWSHYADHHRGFVVELRLSLDAPSELLDPMLPFPVDYAEKRPSVPWGEKADSKQYLLTKSVEWKYEEEERVLVSGAGIYDYSREHFLSSVIAGSRMSDSDFSELSKIVEQVSNAIGKTVPIYRASVSSKDFAVNILGHPNSRLN